MRKLMIAAIAATSLIPVAASAQTRELRQDREEVRRDVRRGDMQEAREDRQELREDWRAYRNSHRNTFRRGQYTAPRGYRYRPVQIGVTLNPAFYGNRYWINDPYTYRLPRAGYNQRYIRYGNDVLLINARNGRVIRVYRNLFW